MQRSAVYCSTAHTGCTVQQLAMPSRHGQGPEETHSAPSACYVERWPSCCKSPNQCETPQQQLLPFQSLILKSLDRVTGSYLVCQVCVPEYVKGHCCQLSQHLRQAGGQQRQILRYTLIRTVQRLQGRHKQNQATVAVDGRWARAGTIMQNDRHWMR